MAAAQTATWMVSRLAFPIMYTHLPLPVRYIAYICCVLYRDGCTQWETPAVEYEKEFAPACCGDRNTAGDHNKYCPNLKPGQSTWTTPKGSDKKAICTPTCSRFMENMYATHNAYSCSEHSDCAQPMLEPSRSYSCTQYYMCARCTIELRSSTSR